MLSKLRSKVRSNSKARTLKIFKGNMKEHKIRIKFIGNKTLKYHMKKKPPNSVDHDALGS